MLKRFLQAKSQGQTRSLFDRKAAKVILLLILFLAAFFIASSSQAITLDVGIDYAKATGLGTEDLRVTVAKIIRAALGFLGILAVALILYGGFLYMTSQGDEAKVLKAKKVIRDAVIGLIIILSAFAIASFILRALMDALYGGGGQPSSYGDGGGALGNGIIESHYPPRNAFDIPRNTSIVVTFKVPMAVDSIINDNGTPEDFSDDLILPASIKIHPTDSAIDVKDARVSYTSDLKTFLFKPLDLLGSAEAPTNYTVELTDDIAKFDGTDAFGDFGGYKWSFEVSTISDITPPQIVSVIPFPTDDSLNAVPRNSVIQINFNEAINPMTIRGLVELAGGGTVGSVLAPETYDLINVKVGTDYVAGEFMYGNQYKTVEFATNDLCGKNTCGDDIFCLPGNENISVLVKAAELYIAGNPSATFPFTGLVDMADNSLDGNLDSASQGPQSQSGNEPYNYNNADSVNQGDDATWSFYTNNIIDLVPPEIDAYLPGSASENVNPATYFMIRFNKIMMATTIKSDSGYNDGYCPCQDSAQCGEEETCDLAKLYCLDQSENKYTCTRSVPKKFCTMGQECVEKEHITLLQPLAEELEAAGYPGGGWGYELASQNDLNANNTTATIIHDPLGENLNFGIRVASGLKDLRQNCYLPCSDNDKCVKEPKPSGLPGEYIQGNSWDSTPPVIFPSCQLP